MELEEACPYCHHLGGEHYRVVPGRTEARYIPIPCQHEEAMPDA